MVKIKILSVGNNRLSSGKWPLRNEWPAKWPVGRWQTARWTASTGFTLFSRGFTLLELLVVLMLASVLLTLTLPAVNASIAGLELTRATRELASALRTVRMQAMVSRHAQTLLLDVAQRHYRFSHSPHIYALPTSLELHLWTAQSESRGAAVAGITFFPDGSATGGRITIQHGTQQRMINVRWLTGQIQIRP